MVGDSPSPPPQLVTFVSLAGKGLRPELQSPRTISLEGGGVAQLTEHMVARVTADRTMEKYR